MTVAAESRVVELLTELAVGVVTCRLYSSEHPRVELARQQLTERLGLMMRDAGDGENGVNLDVLQRELFFEGRPYTRVSDQMGMLVRHMQRHRIERTTFLPGVNEDEIARLLEFLGGPENIDPPAFDYVRIKRVVSVAAGGEALADYEDAPVTLRGRLDAIDEVVNTVASRQAPPLSRVFSVVEELDRQLATIEDPMELLAPLEQTMDWSVVHAHNVAALALALARPLRLGAVDRQDLGCAALLHDVGKFGMTNDQVRQELALTGEQIELDLEHPRLGLERLLDVPQVPEVAVIVAFEHHLKWEGGGTPRLPEARPPHSAAALVAVAEVFDILYTVRLPNSRVTPAGIASTLHDGSGSLYDPLFADAVVTLWQVTVRRAGRMGR